MVPISMQIPGDLFQETTYIQRPVPPKLKFWDSNELDSIKSLCLQCVGNELQQLLCKRFSLSGTELHQTDRKAGYLTSLLQLRRKAISWQQTVPSINTYTGAHLAKPQTGSNELCIRLPGEDAANLPLGLESPGIYSKRKVIPS
jgi:hypothetical protein